MMYGTRTAVAALGALLFGACEQSPVEVQSASEPSDQEVAAAVSPIWSLLAEEGVVEVELIEGLSSTSSPEAVELAFGAGALMAEANDAERIGDAATARVLATAAEGALRSAAVTHGGPAVALRVLSDVEAALEALGSTQDLPPRATAALARAQTLARGARGGLGRGDVAGGLRDGLAASDELRDLDPERRAREVVEAAVALLDRAKELAGPDPRPGIAALLRAADERCDAAVRALEAGQWVLAVRAARTCASMARRVILLLSAGVDDAELEARATALVQEAAELYERAVELAGDSPPQPVARALDEAHSSLESARAALGDGNWREAIRLARESLAISHRVIGFLSGDRPGDGIQARAEAAVAHAVELYERASALAGDPARPEIQAQLDRARPLIDDAKSALQSGDWTRALVKAREASQVLMRVIRLLV